MDNCNNFCRFEDGFESMLDICINFPQGKRLQAVLE